MWRGEGKEYVGNRVMRIGVERRRKGRRPKFRWMHSVNVESWTRGRRDCRGRKSKTGLCGGNLSEPLTHIEVGKDVVED